jgi:phosphate:Na+ symporter
MIEAVYRTDLSRFNQYPVIVFFIVGIALTALIQSSSATIALTLSALYAGAVSLHVATAIILGSEIGTTIKLFIASARGIPAKKRVALGNFLYNIITVLLVLMFLWPVNYLITDVLSIKDNLLALVFFQSFVNLAGIIIFFPLLNPFGRFLDKRFTSEDESFFISKVSVSDSELALEALEKESRQLIFYTLDFVSSVFDTGVFIGPESSRKNFLNKPILDQYDYVKRLHGEIHGFSIRLQNTSLNSKETERLHQLVSTVRNCMYGAKSVRDALQDIGQFRNSSKDVKYGFYLLNRNKIRTFIIRTNDLFLRHQNSADSFGIIRGMFGDIQQEYTKSLQDLYKEGMTQKLNELEISTFINFNREMFTAFKSFLFALKDFLLNPAEANYFDELPGFIR